MMLFQHTWQKVLSGEKTVTRRLAGEYEATIGGSWDNKLPFDVVYTCTIWDPKTSHIKPHRTRYIYEVDKTYAVQPGRGMKAVGRIRLNAIWKGDVRDVTQEDAISEGFVSRLDFLLTWTRMHDKPAYTANRKQDFSDGDESGIISHWQGWQSWLKGTRPAERYQCWVLEFELVAENGA